MALLRRGVEPESSERLAGVGLELVAALVDVAMLDIPVALQQLGGEIETFSRACEVMTEKQAQEVAKLALKVLRDAYGVAKDGEVQIELSLE